MSSQTDIAVLIDLQTIGVGDIKSGGGRIAGRHPGGARDPSVVLSVYEVVVLSATVVSKYHGPAVVAGIDPGAVYFPGSDNCRPFRWDVRDRDLPSVVFIDDRHRRRRRFRPESRLWR